jgi:Flp pilus assembly protein TadD
LAEGNLSVMKNDLDRAIECYRTIVQSDPTDAGALLKLAMVELLAGKKPQARAHLQECRHLDGAGYWAYQIETALKRTET